MPFVLYLLQSLEKSNHLDLKPKEFLPPIPLWVWLLLGAAAFLARFYKLTTLSVWPNYDDGLWGFLAIDFYHHWDWSLFYQDNSYPSAYLWGLGLLFKLFQPSLFLVWFFPAVLSFLVVPMGYAAARTCFSKSLSLLAALLLAFSFWPMFVGRFGNQQILTLLFECLWLFLLGLFIHNLEKPQSIRNAVWLGLAASLGFYIYISWVAIAGFSALTLFAVWRRNPARRLKLLLVFIGTGALSLLPLLHAGLIHNYLRIVHDIGSLDQSFSWVDRFHSAGGYLAAIFWGVPKNIFSYQPVWGGLLNPVTGSLFLLGLREILLSWRLPLAVWLLAGMLLLFIPGVLTHDLEPFRVLPLIPFLMLSCALGLASLLKNKNTKQNAAVVFLLTLSFGGLDFYHLAVRYHRIWEDKSVWHGYAKPMESYRAFGILETLRKEKGPGLIYSDFKPGLCDQTLMVADHAFNAAQNPDLSFKDAQWAAVLANVHYKSFLKTQFPDGKAYFLSAGLDPADGGQMLWIVNRKPETEKVILKWQAASQGFCCFPGRYTTILRNNLAEAYSLFRGDPFLEACFWEKLSDLDFKIGDFRELQKPIEDLEMGIKNGLPSAHLYYRLGVFYLMRSDIPLAMRAFQKAAASSMDLTGSRAILQTLNDSRQKKGEK